MKLVTKRGDLPKFESVSKEYTLECVAFEVMKKKTKISFQFFFLDTLISYRHVPTHT